MTEPGEPLIFISYRRADSSAASRWLAQTISSTFGPQRVFIDIESIRMGDKWAESIDLALQRSRILMPVIGPSWLRLADPEDGRRRLDKAGDWVCNEIAHALSANIRIIPILLSGTRTPKKDALPEKIQGLSQHQAFELRDERWEHDLDLVLARLEQLGLKRMTANPVRYPLPKITITEFTEAGLAAALAKLPKWRIALSALPGSATIKRTELHRTFEFASFADAIGFMSAAVEKINEMDHHPRWENIWRSVSVWLSTWDIGHKPSQLDLELALFLDELRKKFASSRPK